MLIRPAGLGAALRRRIAVRPPSAANASLINTDPATPTAAAERHRANLEKAC